MTVLTPAAFPLTLPQSWRGRTFEFFLFFFSPSCLFRGLPTCRAAASPPHHISKIISRGRMDPWCVCLTAFPKGQGGVGGGVGSQGPRGAPISHPTPSTEGVI
ncbi:hypothetical protein XENOCAPTIV_002806 [Xenoophorus captivus]|uniref:Uncharacterized protein n=1 Tax=Xenoophorus captivus TaxID=1517983 RepID=A0ABV0Q7N9_9TELE